MFEQFRNPFIPSLVPLKNDALPMDRNQNLPLQAIQSTQGTALRTVTLNEDSCKVICPQNLCILFCGAGINFFNSWINHRKEDLELDIFKWWNLSESDNVYLEPFCYIPEMTWLCRESDSWPAETISVVSVFLWTKDRMLSDVSSWSMRLVQKTEARIISNALNMLYSSCRIIDSWGRARNHLKKYKNIGSMILKKWMFCLMPWIFLILFCYFRIWLKSK